MKPGPRAALHGRTEVVTALLDAGVDVNSIVGGGMTTLEFAAPPGCMESNDDLAARLTTIDVLLMRHADVARHDSRDNAVTDERRADLFATRRRKVGRGRGKSRSGERTRLHAAAADGFRLQTNGICS